MPPKPEDVKTESSKKKTGLLQKLNAMQEWWYREFRRIVGAWVFAVVLLFVGATSVVIVDVTDYIFSTNIFCGNLCHVMKSTVTKELQKSIHWTTPTGVRATCMQCHVSKRLSFAMYEHFLGTGEMFVWLTHDFSKPGSFEQFRPGAADRERFKMLGNNSETCAHCHAMEGIKPKRIRGQNMHKEAIDKSIPCIVCHYNLVHKEVEPSEGFLNAIAAYLGDEEEPVDEELDEELEAEGDEEEAGLEVL